MPKGTHWTACRQPSGTRGDQARRTASLTRATTGGAHAELADAQADQGGGEVGVAREVSADGDGFVAERLTGHEDQGPDRRGGAGQVSDAAVAAVDGGRVLGEVVGADAGEVDEWCELVGAESGRWHLDHDSDLE